MLKYELSQAGVRLAARDLVNKLNGNAKLIREYEAILQMLMLGANNTKSRIKAKKMHSAYYKLSEQKIQKTGPNKHLITWYLANDASVAQNRAKVMQGRAMLKQLGLSK